SPSPPMSAPVPLDRQIAAAEREVALRRNVYPHRIATGKMTQAEADRHIAEMEAIVATLRWLRANEAVVRGAIAWVREQPEVQVMLEAFPGSKIVGFRPAGKSG